MLTFIDWTWIFVGNNPLHKAVYQNDTTIVEYLLKYNASTNIQNNGGKSLVNQVTVYYSRPLSRWNSSLQINVPAQSWNSEDASREQSRSEYCNKWRFVLQSFFLVKIIQSFYIRHSTWNGHLIRQPKIDFA